MDLKELMFHSTPPKPGMCCALEELLIVLPNLGTRMAPGKVIWVHVILTSLLTKTLGGSA